MKGEVLSQYRKKAGLTQQQVGDHIGISPQAVSKWENGQTEPDIETVCRLAELYGVPVDVLIGARSDGGNGAEAEKEVAASSSPIAEFIKKNLKMIIIIAAAALALVAIVVTCVILYSAGGEERLLSAFSEIELGMSADEVESILGKTEYTDDTHIDESDPYHQMAEGIAIMVYGYANCDFHYYRGAGYEANQEYSEDNLGYIDEEHFTPYYQIRICFDKDGKVIETYYNVEFSNFEDTKNDYGDGEKTVETLTYLEQPEESPSYQKTVKITYTDGSTYLGKVRVSSKLDFESGEEIATLEHPWGECELDTEGNPVASEETVTP